MKLRLLFALCTLSLSLAAQQSSTWRIARGATTTLDRSGPDYAPAVQCIEQPSPVAKTELQAVKDSLAARYPRNSRPEAAAPNTQRSAVVPPMPTIGASFQGNPYSSSTPCDNEISIGNNGELISVQNTNIFRYNTNNNTQFPLRSLAFFSQPLFIGGSKYDPKVLYDPEANRHIMVFLAGTSSNQTNIIIGFSNSDSVNGTWHLYSLPGNPVGDNTWSDYPMISVNHHDLFITVNRVIDNQPWQTGFAETLIWQVGKWDGYNGDTLTSQLRRNVQFGGRPIRNMCPVEGGNFPQQTNEQYFLSNRNLTTGNDTIFLIRLVGTAMDTAVSITVTPIVSDRMYTAPPDAVQPGNGGLLATNDARVLGAFMQNGLIQYVHNTMDTATGTAGVMHGIITNYTASPIIASTLFSDTAMEYGYPNIAYAGYDGSDNTAMIIMLRTSGTLNPGFVALTSDGNGGYSPHRVVRAGAGPYNVLSGGERWGDYSGIQRRYDVQGTCWVSGMYGLANGTHSTWVAELGISPDVSVPNAPATATEVNVYPNPFTDRISLEFTLQQAQILRFELYDINGRLVEVLLEDRIKAGINRFSFSAQPLPAGVYLLRVAGNNGVVAESKVIRQ
ncbi:MAG: T9SS type A sorting domain-containing protein [Bacteroidia bacterium]|nr:T9SS type A sorting domain-containing protein [Bacteroidia bacterium]